MTDQIEIKPDSEWGDWDGERIDPDTRIRVLAAHPDGGWLIEEVEGMPGYTPGVSHMGDDVLRGYWRPLPYKMDPAYVTEWREKIVATCHDWEDRASEEEKLYRGVLETLLVYPLGDAERVALITATLEELKADGAA